MSPTRDALPRAEPVDLEIHVTTPWGGGTRSIQYMLDSPSGRVGFHKEQVAGPTLNNPDEFQRRLFDQIAGLQEGYDTDGHPIEASELPRELQSIGNQLYRDLFPRGLRRIYRDDVRDHVETLVITSDEPWIPWEILQPNEDDGEFLCMRYRMTRWLAGATALAPGKRVQRLLGMQAGGDLGGSKTELDYLRSLVADVPGLESEILSGASARSVTEEIEGRGFDLFHFAGHGEVDPSRPGESKVLFEDTAVRARHLTPHAQQLLRKARPLVFFNSCHVGRSGNSLTGLGGWASTWVSQCSCSAFVAPLWAVDDHAAELFAATFYWQLSQGSTLGEAVCEGRKVLREQGADSLTWLAYTVYGHPNARFAFGDSQRPTSPMSLPRVRPEIPTSDRSFHRYSLSQRSHSRRNSKTSTPIYMVDPRTLACGGAAVVIALATLAGYWFSEPSPNGDGGGPPARAVVVSPPVQSPEARSDRVAREASDDELSMVVPAPSKQLSIPYQRLRKGRVAILALQGEMPDEETSRAIRSSLLDGTRGFEPILIEARFATQARDLRDHGPLVSNAQTPWGAEYLFVADVERKLLPQRVAHLTGVAMTLTGSLINLETGAVVASIHQTHTGSGPTLSTALAQAADRCLGRLGPAAA